MTHLVKFADDRIEERSSINSMKTLKIYSTDPFIRDLNEQASTTLNDRGCMIFNQGLKMFRKFENNLQLHTDGVLEQFQNNVEKVYQATFSECNCTFTTEYQAPCRHIIFLRSNDDETEIFDVNLFNKRYHRNVSLNALGEEDEEGELTTSSATNLIEEPLSDPEDFDDSDDFRVLTDREKFKMVMPVLLKIGNLIACHSTNDFYGYLDDLEDWKKSIHRGQRIRKRANHGDEGESSISTGNVATEFESLHGDTETNLDTQQNQSTVETYLEEQGVLQDLIQQEGVQQAAAEPSSEISTETAPCRFSELVFKGRLKTKERPKTKSK